MNNEQMLAEIREANLTYLMLAQSLIPHPSSLIPHPSGQGRSPVPPRSDRRSR